MLKARARVAIRCRTHPARPKQMILRDDGGWKRMLMSGLCVWGDTIRVPHPSRFWRRVGYKVPMPKGLQRFHGNRDLHFITCSCYQRRPFLHTIDRRDLFLQLLEETRQNYQFAVTGYVVMPEHFHLLVSEPERGTLSLVMQVLKQRYSRSIPDKANQFWQHRFYDFNVFTDEKRIEKLRYMHRNPVKRGLVNEPDKWAWSSFRAHASHEIGIVQVEG